MAKDQEIIIMKVLCNPTRFDMILLLASSKKDFCVNEIAEGVGISQSLASHQLSYLEAREIVTSTRDGQSVCYVLSLSPITKKLLKVIKLLK